MHLDRHRQVILGIVLVYISVPVLIATPLTAVAGAPMSVSLGLLLVGLGCLLAATALCSRPGDDDGGQSARDTWIHRVAASGVRDAERWANRGR